ncbi:MAG: DNA recombination protein RmuC, partial [Acidobacteria bacterium]
MSTFLALAVGIIAGAVTSWLVTSARGKAAVAESESKSKTAEALVSELRAGLDARARELAALRDQLKSEGEMKVAAETRLQEAQASLEEQKKLLGEAEKKLADTFAALASEALRSNNQAFIQLAKSTFETIQAQAKGDLE